MIIKLDKGFGVVIMDKIEYLCLLFEVFVFDIKKFFVVSKERLKICGCFFKYYYLLL